jgi:hypothetical protein
MNGKPNISPDRPIRNYALRPMTQHGCQMISSWRLLRPALRSLTPKMKVLPVPVRDDNYAYLIIDEETKKAAAVDPYDPDKVSAAAHEHGLQIVAGITTHHR